MPAKFVLNKARNGKFSFTLVAANGSAIAKSGAYETKRSALSAIRSAQKNAATADVDDQTEPKTAPARQTTGRSTTSRQTGTRKTATRQTATRQSGTRQSNSSTRRTGTGTRSRSTAAKPAARRPATSRARGRRTSTASDTDQG